ncbi:TPA: hypothetical protein DCX15_04760 [bacterium]|nr:hypothetical protein [bacterium]
MHRQKGFTLIELMIVIAIIGILAIIAIPRFIDLVDKAREGATKGSLGAIRGALVIYYGDHEGNYPDDINAAWGGRNVSAELTLRPFSAYIEGGQLPRAQLRRRSGATNLDSYTAVLGDVPVTNTGGWLYNSNTGRVFVNSNTVDTKGIVYSTY